MNWDNLLKKRDQYAEVIRQMLCSSGGVTPAFSNDIHEARALGFLSISNWKELSLFLNVSPLKIERLINFPNYKEFTIPKKKGKPREICQPDAELMKIQKKLNSYLQSVYYFQLPECVHGFIPKSYKNPRNIISNALPHVNKDSILSLDIENYFPSIRAKRIFELFHSWGFSQEISTALTLICTYKGSLPTGAPSSPILSNLCSIQLDLDLMKLSELHQLSYTRYADDLTFSSHSFITDSTIIELMNCIKSNGFSINKRKVRCLGQNRKQKITGIVVNKKISVDRQTKKKLRAIMYDIKINGLDHATKRNYGLQSFPSEAEQQTFIKKVLGIQSFLKMVENHRFGMG
jgi:RNA-directed DNA polymerase